MFKKFGNIQEQLSNLYLKMSNSSIFFLMGVDGVIVLEFKKGKILSSIFCKNDKLSEDPEFINFISRKKKSRCKIILNTSEISLEHQSHQVIESLANINPIEKYCDSHFHNSDIYSYKVYSIEKGTANSWKAILLWTPITEAIQKILSLIQENDIIFDGFYFYDLFTQDIAKSLSSEHKIDFANIIYCTISINLISGINININNNNNILGSTRIEYPLDKSEEYIQGIIEQALSDFWLKYKTYIEQNNLKKVNFFIVPERFKKLLDHQNHNVDMSVFAKTRAEEEFSDNLLVEYFSKTKPSIAKSKEFRSYHKYVVLNSLLFKPIYLVISLIIVQSVFLNFRTSQLEKQVSTLYDEYTKTSEEVRLKAQDFPDISNIYQFADLHNVQSFLKQKKTKPFDIINEFIQMVNNESHLTDIFWEQPKDKEDYINAKITFTLNSANMEDSLKLLESKILSVKEKYKNFDFSLRREKIKDESAGELAFIIDISGGSNDNK